MQFLVQMEPNFNRGCGQRILLFSLVPLDLPIPPRYERKRVETDENGPNQNNNRGQGTNWHQIKLILSEFGVFQLQFEPSFKEFGGVWQTL